jgi:hypothetical protein
MPAIEKGDKAILLNAILTYTIGMVQKSGKRFTQRVKPSRGMTLLTVSATAKLVSISVL